MALPKFTKTGLTDLTISKGYLFPARHQYIFNQIRGMSEGGKVRVATLRDPDQYFPLHFERLSYTDFTEIRDWLLDPLINGSANTFTFYDLNGDPHVVRWWPQDGVFDMPESSYGLYTFDILLKVEV